MSSNSKLVLFRPLRSKKIRKLIKINKNNHINCNSNKNKLNDLHGRHRKITEK